LLLVCRVCEDKSRLFPSTFSVPRSLVANSSNSPAKWSPKSRTLPPMCPLVLLRSMRSRV
jgi:hypothetical protein